MCGYRLRVPVMLMALAFSGLSGDAAADINVGGQVTVVTDYLFRGVSQTMSGAAAQAELDIAHDSGWYGYAWASNVDFTDSATPDDGAAVEFDLAAGYVHSIGDNVTVGLEATAYLFPGTKDGYDYDYTELQGSFTLHDRHSLTIAYSDDVFGSGTEGIFYALGSGLALSEQLSLGVELGYYDLSDGYDMAYSYAQMSLAGALKSLGWQLSYVTTADEAGSLFYESTIDDQLTFALTMSF